MEFHNSSIIVMDAACLQRLLADFRELDFNFEIV